jgi:hypothetical protein
MMNSLIPPSVPFSLSERRLAFLGALPFDEPSEKRLFLFLAHEAFVGRWV